LKSVTIGLLRPVCCLNGGHQVQQENLMNNYPLAWIISGISGSGKTAVGQLLAQRLECDFLEGDRRHPVANIIKMRSHQPLQDNDRRPWLEEIESDIKRAIEKNRETVITCSALKASYRNQLTAMGKVQLVWIDVSRDILEQRLKARPEHYMTVEMLDSQIAAFEKISLEEDVLSVMGNLPIDQVLDKLMIQVIQRFPCMKKPWWQRI
jgi:gluconokinase